MKREYELTHDEFIRIINISKREAMPVMKIGNVWTGNEKQEDANTVWKELGNKYGFVWDSAEPVPGKSQSIFKATPK